MVPTAFEHHRWDRKSSERQGKIADLAVSVLNLVSDMLCELKPVHPRSEPQFSKDAPTQPQLDMGKKGSTYLRARGPRKPKRSFVSNSALRRRDCWGAGAGKGGPRLLPVTCLFPLAVGGTGSSREWWKSVSTATSSLVQTLMCASHGVAGQRLPQLPHLKQRSTNRPPSPVGMLPSESQPMRG